jgi:hypothetical protein
VPVSDILPLFTAHLLDAGAALRRHVFLRLLR